MSAERGEWRYTYPGYCQPKERAQSAAEKAAGLLEAGAKVLYGKGSIYGSEAGTKRHMARCPCEPRSRAGTRSERRCTGGAGRGGGGRGADQDEGRRVRARGHQLRLRLQVVLPRLLVPE